MLASRHGHTTNSTISACAALMGLCLSLNSHSFAAESIHAFLFKLGLHCHTFLGNRLLHLYSRAGAAHHAFNAFHDISTKNVFSYNVLLEALCKGGCFHAACRLFDEMPERDSVSWNSMISGSVANGEVDKAFELLYAMQVSGVRVSGFTYTIAASCVSLVQHAKQVHASAMRNGLNLFNTIVANSLIDMYGRVGLSGYAFGVFQGMASHNVISWNSIISVYGGCGCGYEALECFQSMKASGFSPDDFTLSALVSVCAELRDLVKGEQLLAWSLKAGCLSNSIVSSAVIDMYSKCDRLDDAVRLFETTAVWDSALCNSMISGYAQNGLVHEALKLFVLALRMDVRPTEFTFASILSSNSCFGLTEQGTQIHCWVLKIGLEAEMIVGSGIVDMYAKLGSIDAAIKVFSAMVVKDLVSWNVMITGLAQNGQGVVALRMLRQLQVEGLQPDRITLHGALSACGNEGMIHEAYTLFLQMEEKYGIACGIEHYACMVDMMALAGMLEEAMEIIETMPCTPTEYIWGSLLEACRIHGELGFAELVADKLMELETHSPLPYFVLARIYATKGKWESMARVWRGMKEKGVTMARGCSWTCIKNQIFIFKSKQILHCGGEATYSILYLLHSELENEGYIPQQHAVFGDNEEE